MQKNHPPVLDIIESYVFANLDFPGPELHIHQQKLVSDQGLLRLVSSDSEESCVSLNPLFSSRTENPDRNR